MTGDGSCLFRSIQKALTTPEKTGPSVREQRDQVSKGWNDEIHADHVTVADGSDSAATE